MAKTVIGLYDTFEQAQRAVHDLRDQGFEQKEISLIANDTTREHARHVDRDVEVESDASGAAKGAGIGAGIGGVAGLLVGLGALAIPGIGPIVAAGPLAAALAGAGVGAVTGGLIGALTDMGVPEEEAGHYAEAVRRGGTLVAVQSDDARAEQASAILSRHHPIDLDRRVTRWRENDWSGHNREGDALTEEELAEERRQYVHAPGVGGAGMSTRHEPDALKETGTSDRAFGTASMDTHADTARPREETRIPVVQEDVNVGKREVEQGGIRVQTRTEERPVEEQVRLRDEEVNVERRPVDRPVQDRDLDAAFQNRTIEVRETDEEAVIEKQARVVEEVVIGKEVNEHTQTVRDTARQTKVDVERLDAGQAAGRTEGVLRAGTFADYEPDFRRHHEGTFARAGRTYDTYAPAYQHGYALAGDERHRTSDWQAVEPEARRSWEERHREHGTWDEFRDAVRHAWQRARDRA